VHRVPHTYRVEATCAAYPVAEWGHVPFGRACQPIWHGLTHDACVSSSNILSIVTCLRRRHCRLVAYPLLALALRRAFVTRTT